jgi:GntR family transcriptional regulator, carbon starvation induced regulator
MTTGRSKTLVETVYRQIRADIVHCLLAPGSPLRVEHIKDRYGASGGTMREALSLLVADSLVIAEGRKGFRVTPLSLEDLDDVTENRVRLETEALRQSIEHGDVVWESEIVATYHLLSRIDTTIETIVKKGAAKGADEYETKNGAFHRALISACPSRWLLHFIDILYRQSERYRYLLIEKRPIHRDVHAEHTALMNAVLKRESDAAASVLAEHIRTSARAIRAISTKVQSKKGAKQGRALGLSHARPLSSQLLK